MYLPSIFTFLLTAVLTSITAMADSSFTYERLNKNDSVLVIVDLQIGLSAGVRDREAGALRNAILAHASIGRDFELPVVLTTSVEHGPNGPLPQEIIDMFPNAPLISRLGEVNAWDNADFRAAIQATGKHQVIMAGIATDVCAAFLALSLRQEGYHVVLNAEASGSFDTTSGGWAIGRMQAAGVQVMSYFTIACELFRDWRSTNPNGATMLKGFSDYVPSVGYFMQAHAAAVENGTLLDGELALLDAGDTNASDSRMAARGAPRQVKSQKP